MSEAAREAEEADLPAIGQLLAEARLELAPQRGGRIHLLSDTSPALDAEGFAQSQADPGRIVLVGTVDDVVVGFAQARLDTLADGSLLAVVEWIYVHPEARGVGLGEALLDALVAWAVRSGAAGIDAVALPGMRETKNFFETFGMTARAIVVHARLGEESQR